MGENLTERAMGLFVTRTLGDGVLDTRGYKLRCFAENLLCAAAAPASLAVATRVLGGGAGTILVVVLGAAVALVVAPSARPWGPAAPPPARARRSWESAGPRRETAPPAPARGSPRRPREPPVSRSLSGFFAQLVGLVDRACARDERRPDLLRDRLLRDHALGDVLARGQLEHHVQKRGLDDRAQSPRASLALERLVRDLPQRVLGEDELDRVVAEEALVLLHERVLRLGQDLHEILALELVHGRDDGQPADELGNESVAEQVFRHHLGMQRGQVVLPIPGPKRGAEADGALADALADDLLEARERAPADEEDVRRVDREELLVRVLASALW